MMAARSAICFSCKGVLADAKHAGLRFEPRRPIYALAGYFRSGNSWTRHLLQRATGILTGSTPRTTLRNFMRKDEYSDANAHAGVYNDAALQRTGLWGEGVTEGTLCVKTHLMNTTIFHFSDLQLLRNGEEPRPPPIYLPAKGAIHLVRNPFDSIASWHQYLVTGSHFETIEDFDPDQWEQHVVDEVDWWIRTTEYWLQSRERDPNFRYMLVRYEDLQADTEGVLYKMLRLIEAPIDEPLIKCAVRSTDCAAMPWNCRSGNSGNSLRFYSNEQRDYMIRMLGPLMLFLNYSVKDIPFDSNRDYVLGFRTPFTGYPLRCRQSSRFIEGNRKIKAMIANSLTEEEATPMDVPPEVLYEPPLIVFHPDWANWMGWAAADSKYYHNWGKVTIEKRPSQCRWSWNYKDDVSKAHVVLMNGVPHVGKGGHKWYRNSKFGLDANAFGLPDAMYRCNKEYDAPLAKPFWQKWARMDYETYYQFPILAHKDWTSLFDWNISWEKDSDLHITMHCPFPTERTALDDPPEKEPGHLIAYIASRCEARERDEYVRQLMQYVPVTSYGRCLNNAQLPDERSGDWPRNWDIKIRVVGTFKFALAFENYNLTDWVTEKMPQIIMAGAVPIYMGAPNIDEYLPGPHSIIKVSDFESPRHLAEYIRYLDENDEEYQKYFEWKKYPLAKGWEQDYADCGYWQEHKLCEMALTEQAALRERWRDRVPEPAASEEVGGGEQKNNYNQDEPRSRDGEAESKEVERADALRNSEDDIKKEEQRLQEGDGEYLEESGAAKRKRITAHIGQHSKVDEANANNDQALPQRDGQSEERKVAAIAEGGDEKTLSEDERLGRLEEEKRRQGLADPKNFPVKRSVKRPNLPEGHEPNVRSAEEVAEEIRREQREKAEKEANQRNEVEHRP